MPTCLPPISPINLEDRYPTKLLRHTESCPLVNPLTKQKNALTPPKSLLKNSSCRPHHATPSSPFSLPTMSSYHHTALPPLPGHHNYDSLPSPSPSPSNTVFFHSTNAEPSTSSSSSSSSPPPSKFPVEFSPPLIAMVVIIAAALVIMISSRLVSRHFLNLYRRFLRWRHRRHREFYLASSSISNIDSPPYPFDPTSTFHIFSPGGLVESAIKSIPLSIYSRKSNSHNCAICLLEFKENDYVRTLPVCSHDFHVDCIDIWLRSHANCPLCRAVIFRPESPFTPVMATRIRPDLDDIIIQSTILEPLTEIPPKADSNSPTGGEITQEQSPGREDPLSEDRYNARDFLLKRSYSFGFERNLGSERLVVEPVTASPWRYRRGVGSFWSKRPSPFNSLTKSRVFSFRSYRGMNMKSPFFRRRGEGSGIGFFPLSESSARYSGGSGGGGSSRRRNNMSLASPMFLRSSAGGVAASSGLFLSSRLRSGDPEALLSPDRFNKR
ncbi:hypothetical protein M9H77_20336 [Catharanthus roseus]|uniref:Uncharacterized protein n=1 Tax=Catharanthus roseus TaxID=4058 RepID=A0ACC0ANK9_CATRO|nr:hypothetical protein M9H77_20336 [Catharanthus roseus]